MNHEDSGYYKDNMAFNDAMDTLDSLAHYGVPGMKWGVRNEETLRKYYGGGKSRGQRPGDTTRTSRRQTIVDRFRARQMRRKAKANRSLQNEAASQAANPKALAEAEVQRDPDSVTTGKPKSSGGHKIREANPRTLSDDELRTANQRLQDEITYKQRQAQLRQLNMTKGERRRQAIRKQAVQIGGNVLTNFATKQIGQYLNKITQGGAKPAVTAAKVKRTVEKSTKPAAKKILASIESVSADTPVSSYIYQVRMPSGSTSTSTTTSVPAEVKDDVKRKSK